MRKLTLSTVLFSLVLTGCATQSQCDSNKSDPSMLEKLNCDVGGGYQRQVEQSEQNLVDARAENELFNAVYVEIDAQRQAVRQDLSSQQQQQAKLQDSLGQLLRQLKLKHANKAAALAQISDLQAQVHTLQQHTSSDPKVVEAKQRELAELKRQVSRLQLSLGY